MDKMRSEYRELSEYEKELVKAIKLKGEQLYELFDAATSSPREIALAKTKLEECVMWAVKGITG